MTSIYPSSSTSSTNSSTSSANLLRISGMSSGIDTDSVVKSMVSDYQAKIDKANQAKQTYQWQQEVYQGIIKDIKGLQDYFDPLSSKYILSENSLNINTAATDDSSIVSATSGSTAKAGTYNIKVSQLAEQAKIEGTSKNSIFQVANGSEWSGAQLTIGADTINLDSITDTNADGTVLDQVADAINTKISTIPALNGNFSASYVNDASGKYIKFTNNTGSSINLSATTSNNSTLISTKTITDTSSYSYTKDASSWSGAKLTFNVDGTDIPIDLDSITDTNGNGTTLDDIAANINKKISGTTNLNGKVSASYINDGTNSYIKFTNTSTSSISLTAQTQAPNHEFISNQSLNAEISSTSNLVSDLGFTAGTVSFKVNDSTISFTVDSNTTMKNLMDQVNSATGGAVTMSIDNTTGKILFQSKSYGSASNISITNINTSSTNVIQKLGIKDSAANNETFTGIQGKDAIVSIKAPGQSAATTTTQSSNQFTLNGVSYNLVAVNTAANPDSNITVTGNSDAVVSNVKKFIDDYNSVISTINTKLTEKKDPNYPPLTDAQKSSMSESQITAWEAKAKVGILRNDDYLSSLLTQLRGAFSSPVYSSYTNSSTNTKISLNVGKYGSGAIGIDTSSTNHTDGGMLYIKDQAKLKSAIENNLDDFKKLFIGKSSDTLSTNQSYISSTKYMEDGIFTRMDTILRDYVAAPGVGEDGTYTLSGKMNIFVNKQYDYSALGTGGKNTLPDQLYSKTLGISKLKTQMSDAQTRYYNKFTALETAMNNLNAQQSQLSSMLGTG